MCLHHEYADVWTDPAHDDDPGSLAGRRSAAERLAAARAWWASTRGPAQWRERRLRPPRLAPSDPDGAAQLRAEARQVVATMRAEGVDL